MLRLGGEKWPATSACLNPLDYFVWSKLKTELRLTRQYPVDTTTDLQTSALKVIRKFETDPEWQAQLRKARQDKFWRRCEQVARNDGRALVPQRTANQKKQPQGEAA